MLNKREYQLNTSNQELGRSNMPISMLEMAFNEINPYRDNNLGDNTNNISDSYNMNATGYGPPQVD